MEIPDELKADSGLKTHVRDAIRPHLEFIYGCLSNGISEAAIHRHLLKKGHKVGSRSGFGAALKYLLREEHEKGAVRVSDSRLAPSAGSVSPQPKAAVSSADAKPLGTPTSARAGIKNLFADDRNPPAFGTH